MNIILAGKLNWTKEEIKILSRNNNIIYSPNEEVELTIEPDTIDIIICNWFFKYHDIRKFKNLKFIQLLSVGYNGIDTKIVKEMGITLYNAKDVYSIPISEFVIGNLLAYYKHLSFFIQNKNKHKWEKNRTLQELYSKKILIVGTGSIGTEIAKRLTVFTNNIFGCNRTIRETPYFIKVYPINNLSEIISRFDVLILSVALTEETKYLINKTIFNKMTHNTIIVNISRGAVIEEKELVSALLKNKINGAILDVFEEEPLPEDSPLWNMENVILTPHNSFISDRTNERLKKTIVQNYLEWEKHNGKGENRMD